MTSFELGIDNPETLAALRARMPIALGALTLERLKETERHPDYQYPVSRDMLNQFLPNPRELDSATKGHIDPTNERSFNVADGLIQVYDNRALYLGTTACFALCRYCFREDIVGRPSRQDHTDALYYLGKQKAIKELILSGGDPMTIPSIKLIPLIRDFLEVVPRIRIDTRAVTLAPERVTDELLKFFDLECRDERKAHRVSFVNQINHPDEFNHPKVWNAIYRIKDIGMNIFNQAVLLNSVNAKPETQRKLWEDTYELGIAATYLYLLDDTPGTAHFQVSDKNIIRAYQALDGLPGPAIPTLTYVNPHTNKKEKTGATSPRRARELRAFLAARKRDLQSSTPA